MNADGTNRRALTTPTDEMHLAPAVLAGSSTALFMVTTGDRLRIDAIGLNGRGRKTVLDNASQPLYLASGHLMFMRDGDVMVVPFDPVRVGTLGPVVSLGLDVVLDMVNDSFPVPQLAAAGNGTLVYAVPADNKARQSTLMWVDRAGHELDTLTVPFGLPYFQLSPDGSTLALMGRRGGAAHIATFDLVRKAFTDIADVLARGTSVRVTPEESEEFEPAWNRDGRHVTFSSTSGGGTPNLFWALADGSRPMERLATSPRAQLAASRNVTTPARMCVSALAAASLVSRKSAMRSGSFTAGPV